MGLNDYPEIGVEYRDLDFVLPQQQDKIKKPLPIKVRAYCLGYNVCDGIGVKDRYGIS